MQLAVTSRAKYCKEKTRKPATRDRTTKFILAVENSFVAFEIRNFQVREMACTLNRLVKMPRHEKRRQKTIPSLFAVSLSLSLFHTRTHSHYLPFLLSLSLSLSFTKFVWQVHTHTHTFLSFWQDYNKSTRRHCKRKPDEGLEKNRKESKFIVSS